MPPAFEAAPPAPEKKQDEAIVPGLLTEDDELPPMRSVSKANAVSADSSIFASTDSSLGSLGNSTKTAPSKMTKGGMSLTQGMASSENFVGKSEGDIPLVDDDEVLRMMQEMGVDVQTGESAAAPADILDDDEVLRMMKELEQSTAGGEAASANPAEAEPIDDAEILKMMAEVGAMAEQEQKAS